MLNWIIDARDIRDEQAFDYGLLLKTHDIEDFLFERRDNIFFVMAPKGLGKTFVLKAKSINYIRDGIPLIHDNMLVDKPGSPAIVFNKDKLSLFSSYQNWVNLWSLSIGLSVLKKLKLTDKINAQCSSAIKKLIELPLSTITDYCKCILSISRNEFYEITQNDLNNLIIPLLKRVNTAIAAFIDNVDEYFDTHINKYKFSRVSSEGVVSKDIWYLSQMGLIEAVYQLTNNPHLKIFVSIRKEAYLKLKEIDSKAPQYKGSGIDLTYSHEELKEIFIKNILREKKDRLSHPDILEKDPILAFLGIKNIEHDRTGRIENIFDYIARHTLSRPRDFMVIGSELSRTRVPERNQEKIKEIINNVSSEEIAHEYIKEVEPHIDGLDFDKAFSLIDSNILTLDQIKQICCSYNNQNNNDYAKSSCSSCTKNHIFCTLYMLGLLGITYRESIRNELRQKFLAPGIKPFDMIGKLESLCSEVYLIHPCLYGLILKNNPRFKPDDIEIVGYNYTLQDYFNSDEERKGNFDILYNNSNKYCHVHIGAGKLGLGLVVPLIKDQSKRIIVIQKPSEKWKKLRNCDNITLKINGNEILEFDIIHESADSASMKYVMKNWENGKDLLVITSDQRYQKMFLEQSNSISTALGENLSEIGEVLRECNFNKSINLYPFENSKEDVRRLSSVLRSNINLTVVPVVADRICSNRNVENNYINIQAEEFYEVIAYKINESVSELFFDKENVLLTNSNEEQDFFYRRKLYIINGVHMIMALYSYGYLIEKGINEGQWKDYALTVVLDAFDPGLRKIKNFVKIQVIRLISETDEKLLNHIHTNDNKKYIFDKIYSYGETFISRVQKTTDEVGRILKLNRPNQLEAKFKNRIQKMIQYVSAMDESTLSYLGIDSQKILRSVIDLQEQSNSVFLKLLVAQQSGALDRQSAALLGGK